MSNIHEISKALDKVNEKNRFRVFDRYGLVDSITNTSQKYNTKINDNMNLPYQFLTKTKPGVLEQLFQPMTAEMLVGPMEKVVDWAQTQYQVFYMSMAGDVDTYSDYAAPKTVDNDLDWYNVAHYRLHVGATYGTLEQAQYNQMGIDIANKKVNRAIFLLRQKMNQLFWYGYQVGDQPSDRDIQGILNNSTLNNVISLTDKIGGANYDIDKAVKFFGKVYETLIIQTGSLVTLDTAVNIGVPTAVYSTLNSLYNKYSNTNFMGVIKNSFPNINIILCPELNKSIESKDSIVAIVPEIPGSMEKTGILGFSEEALFSMTTRNLDATYEKVSSGLCGFICYQPAGVVRFKDVVAS